MHHESVESQHVSHVPARKVHVDCPYPEYILVQELRTTAKAEVDNESDHRLVVEGQDQLEEIINNTLDERKQRIDKPKGEPLGVIVSASRLKRLRETRDMR